MIERKHIPIDAEYSVNIVTEQMADGTWAVVSSIKHESPTGEKIIDLPVCDDRYATQTDAEDAGFSQARDWIDRNMPRAA
jgi:AICAR transformylase/IMP cyclohydrolase PurH